MLFHLRRKTKEIITADKKKLENTFQSLLELNIKTTKLHKARENANHLVVIGFSFASDWWRKWCEYSDPITERSKAKPVQSRITFDTQLKLLYSFNFNFDKQPQDDGKGYLD